MRLPSAPNAAVRALLITLLPSALSCKTAPVDDGTTDDPPDTDTVADTDTVDTDVAPDTDVHTDTDLEADTDLTQALSSVLQHHNHATRDGVYVDASLTRAVVGTMHADPGFSATVEGAVYAQPLFVDGGGVTPDVLFVTTEKNNVYALNPLTGAELWHVNLGAPVPLSSLPCGNINPLGVTGTAAIDLGTQTLYVDAMTSPDGGAHKKHLIFGVALSDGTTRAGFPVDVDAALATSTPPFDSAVQNERGALVIAGGELYVPYGGHYGDCGAYHGWVVGVPLAHPEQASGWQTAAHGGGSWAPGGLSSDGTSVFLATGNTFGATTWSGGEAIIRLDAGPVFGGTKADYFAPDNWKILDAGDVDIGGSGPVLFDLAGASPSRLALSLGKNGNAYLLDRDNLGGVSVAPVAKHVDTGEIITAAVAYTTSARTFVAFHGDGNGIGCPHAAGDMVALEVGVGAPPTLATAWCADSKGLGAPMITTTDGHAEAILWNVGAEGDGKLHAFDAETGAVLFAGGGASDVVTGAKRYNTPIAAKGRVYAAGTNNVVAFIP